MCCAIGFEGFIVWWADEAWGGRAMRPFPQSQTFVFLVCTCLGAAPAEAQITLAGGEVQVTTTTSASAYQGTPAVAWEPAGNFVIGWQQQSATTGGWDIFAQLFQSNGSAAPTALAPAFQVSGPSTAFCRQTPAVAADAAGDFVIVWASNEGPGGTNGVFGQFYNSAGQTVGQRFQVNTTTTYDDQAPAVAMTGDGRFLVVWQSSGQDGSSWGVFARAYATGGGGPVTGEIAVNLTTAGAQHSPAVAFLPPSAALGPRFEVAWVSEGQDGAGTGASGIFARSFDGAGNPQSGELAINAPATGAHSHPRIASDPSGNFVVAWEDLTASGSVVLVRRFKPAGTALSGQLTVDPSPTGAQHDPVVAANAAGDFVVVWDEAGQDGSGQAVLALLFDNQEHVPPGVVKLQLNTTTAGDQAFAGAGLSSGGSLLVAWQSQTPAADAAVITARAATLPLGFFTVAPCRMVDTRNANGSLGGPILTTGQTRNFPVLSAACGVPATAKALSVNLTAVLPSAAGSLVLYPGDATLPASSNLNFDAGSVRANNAVVGLSRNGDGSVTVLPSMPPGGQLHFIIDVNGYFQ
jgi:hypothetical protein